MASAACSGSAATSPVRPPPDQSIRPPDDGGNYAAPPPPAAVGALVLVDRQTRSTWNLAGQAIAGPAAAAHRQLRQLPGVSMFWFAWSVFFPGSEIWGRPERARDASLPADKTGSPACGGGRDCIPSLPNTGVPRGDLAWTHPGAADVAYLADDDLVLGVFVDGAARAYPENVLWWHEIANDHVGARHFSVTFCPLTGSGVGWESGDAGRSFGVSGHLFDSNLVMYDHQTESLWPQLWMGAVSGANQGTWLTMMPLSQMTWVAWRALHPDTLVLSANTGYDRDYTQYPYGDYRTNDASTFRVTDPLPDPRYPNKAMTFGLIDRPSGAARAYVYSDLAASAGTSVAVNDEFGGRPVVVVYERDAQLALVFDRETADGTLTFDAAVLAR